MISTAYLKLGCHGRGEGDARECRKWPAFSSSGFPGRQNQGTAEIHSSPGVIGMVFFEQEPSGSKRAAAPKETCFI